MEILNKIDLRPKTILKIMALVFIFAILLVFLFQILGSAFRSVSYSSDLRSQGVMNSKSFAGMPMQESDDFGFNDGINLSARNMISEPPYSRTSSGNTAEDFEVTEFNGTIETRKLKETCSRILGLKDKNYVVFENANEYDHGCNFSFKVEVEQVGEVLAVIEELDPRDLSENTHTIKRQIDDYTSETEILVKKKETIESTLENAIRSYDEISRVATQARDAESLAKIIDSKIRIIERLSQERINISEQIDRINRAKAEQLDRLSYTYFYINVYENKFVDVEQIKDSWKNEVKRSVRDLNEIAQNVSINLVTAGFTILQYLLYIFLLLIAAKYFWRLAVYFWKK